MNPRGTLVGFCLAVALLIPHVANAAYPGKHYFDCKLCHLTGYTITQLSGSQICLQCHTTGVGGGAAPYNPPLPDGLQYDAMTDGLFSVNDASNLFGNGYTGATPYETSHTWAAPDTLAAAGAKAPNKTTFAGFYSRYGASHGKVTCSRCHDPHGEAITDTAANPASPDNPLANPMLLARDVLNANKPMTPEQMCEACHVDFDKPEGNHGFLTHPLITDYDAVLAKPEYLAGGAKEGWLKPAIGNGAGFGDIKPYSGVIRGGTTAAPTIVKTYSNGVACLSCHSIHYVDSSSLTADGVGNAGTLNSADGKLLRTDGRSDSGDATASSNLCSACHAFGAHGSPSSKIGCLDCHGGHVPGSGNSYVLRNEVTLSGGVIIPKTGTSTSMPLNYPAPGTLWMNGGTGYCEGCHNIPASVPQHTVPGGEQANMAYCGDCHNHANQSGSFGGACNSCHGFAPSDGAVEGGTTGYAKNDASGVTYLSVSGGSLFKNESNTPHKRHANGGATDYSFSCAECHYSVTLGVTPEHADDNYQDVLFEGPLSIQGGAPSYTATGTGSCATVYCHSNGQPRGGVIKYAASAPVWDGGAGDIPAGTCNVCHGSDATTMAAAQRNNSASHLKHVARYACNVCHSNTAASSAALKVQGGDHVDGKADEDVLFDENYDLGAALLSNAISSNSYEKTGGTCAVYCHSNGTVETSPDWDTAPTGNSCGICHQYNNGGVAAGSGPALGGAHSRHVFDTSGPQLACTVCHSNNGSGADHINGAKSFVANLQNVCNACHGATSGTAAGNDREPNWNDNATVDCATCHLGTLAVIGGDTAPAKQDYYTKGHWAVAAAKNCTDCHDAAAAGHFDAAGDKRLLTLGGVAYATPNAWCQQCHAGYNEHFAHAGAPSTSDPANLCTSCHEVHGTGTMASATLPNANSMLRGTIGARTVVGYDKIGGKSDTDFFVETPGTNFGICQVCHDPTNGGTGGGIAYYNRTTAGSHNRGSVCTSCHSHGSSPAFGASGDSCDSCHGYPPNTNAHAVHAPDSLVADAGGKVYRDATNGFADVTACASCHTGADLYTYDPSADRTSGTANRQNHGAGEATQDGTLNTSVGYNATTFNCTSACHAQVNGQAAAWTATSLTCDSCHLNPPADGGGDSLAHGKHIAAGSTCATCHVSVPVDTAHISVKTGATELARVQNAAQALADEADVVVTTWNDTNNTCGNAACHAPSGDGKLADWDSSVSSCILCHGDAATMVTGNHDNHLALDTDCAKCHPSAGANMAHLNGSLQVNAALNYSGEVLIPNTAYGTCNSTVCHYDPSGKSGANAAVLTGDWDEVAANSCTICHSSPSDFGDHQAHFSAGRVANGMTCYTCHSGTVTAGGALIPVAGGGKHLDGSKTDVTAAGNYDATAVTMVYSSIPADSSCTANCHTTGNPKNWTPATSCESCHGNLSSVGATHTAHINIVGGIAADLTECSICHGDVSGYGLGESGNHQNGTTDLAAGISTDDCTSACHSSISGGDGSWADVNGLNCDACHGNPPAGSNHAKHIAAGMACTACHGTVDAAGTHPLTHNHGKDLDASTTVSNAEALQSRGNAALNPTGLDIVVDDAGYNGAGGTTWVNSAVTSDGGNSCANTVCHNPSSNGKFADWDVSVASCTLCHGDDQAGTLIATGSHNQHLNANSKFGITIDCDRCHQDNGTDTAHFMTAGVPDAAVQFNGTVITTQYQGEAAIPNTGYGTCTTNTCHNNGKGGAPVTAFTWGTAVATDCQFCHDDPPVSGRHQTHLGATVNYGPYGGVASTNCGDCHDANNNLTMTGKATHINGVINFDDGNSVSSGGIVANATVSSCNICHGAQAATANANAALAKAQWNTAARLTCESCHGDYALADSLANGGGIAAPSRAGAGYDNSGHGKAGVAQACSACHATTAAHISAATGDTNRLQVIGGKDFASDANGFCNACHTTLADAAAHYGNTQTSGGSSNDGLTCVTCHDGHGQNDGQAQMVASTIQGRAVTGFTDKNARASYGNAGFTGVCQVCHDPAEVSYFNRTTNAQATHNSSSNCLTCHSHSATPAFAASGCNGCHGDSAAGNYWPDSVGGNTEDDAGEHAKHIEVLAARVYGQAPAQLLAAVDTDARQKALCEYCHAALSNDSNHAGTVNDADVFVDADAVRHAKHLNGAADGNATYTAASDTCSNVDCHNSKTTTASFSWYASPGVAATTDCLMCHTVGALGANPTTGLHNTSAAGVTKHDGSAAGFGSGCATCHTQPSYAPASTHIDGTWAAESGVNTDRFLNNVTFTYTEAPVNTSTCTAVCHADNNRWARQWSTAADSTSTTPGDPRCDTCHGWLGDWRSGLTVAHNLPKINDGTHSDCEQCHVAFNAPYTFATMHEDNQIQVNNDLSMNYVPAAGTCTVAACHGATPTRGSNASTWLTEALLDGNDVSCNACHDARGGFSSGRAGHTAHVTRTATGTADYGDTNIYSTDLGGYSYGCGNCHPTNANFGTLHNNGVVNITLNNTHGGTIKSQNSVANDTSGYSQSNTVPNNGGVATCSAAFCHSDAAGTFKTTPDWYGSSTFSNPGGDYCQNCHGNQPTTGSHTKHAVGIHYDDVYSGTTGLLGDAAATGAGHGDVTTAITINCNMCHATTVNQWRNDKNTACISCHNGEGNDITRNDTDLKKSLHVNGVKNVAFTSALALRSKAQLRDDITTVPEINANWTRQNGYKQDDTSHDLGPTLSGSWTSPNCTVACHNSNTIAWGTSATCSSCHTQLPK